MFISQHGMALLRMFACCISNLAKPYRLYLLSASALLFCCVWAKGSGCWKKRCVRCLLRAANMPAWANFNMGMAWAAGVGDSSRLHSTHRRHLRWQLCFKGDGLAEELGLA